MMDRLYQYILKLCQGPKGSIIMSIVSFTEAVFFIIPPDPFLGLLCIKQSYKRIINLVFACLICSVVGGCIGYYLGEEIVNFNVLLEPQKKKKKKKIILIIQETLTKHFVVGERGE